MTTSIELSTCMHTSMCKKTFIEAKKYLIFVIKLSASWKNRQGIVNNMLENNRAGLNCWCCLKTVVAITKLSENETN